jgi:hypothetical protein
MTLPYTSLGGPCAGARQEVDTSCAEAERLAQAAVAHQQRLRETRRQLHEVTALRATDAQVRDRRALATAKDEARAAYRKQMITATDMNEVQLAARAWLREMDRLNRQLAIADQRAQDVLRRAAELERQLPGIELAADAARIAAETAREACVTARRLLADCEEETQRRLQPEQPQPTGDGPLVISLVLRGDRHALLRLGLRLADETGAEAGRLQLLLLELREAIHERALQSTALLFPAKHPFWSQFPASEGREVAISLAAMGYRFDGSSGWIDGRVPTIRELAVALSHAGHDPRGLRRPAGQQAIDELWQGTTVLVEDYLAACAPGLELEQVMACLGPAAANLSELWDMWGRLKPLLLASA